MGVDQFGRIYVNESLIDTWTPEEITGVLEHEINHLLRQHPFRGGIKAPTDPDRWNVAADCEINDDLLAFGTKLPRKALTGRMFKLPDNWTAEQYYDKLPPSLSVPMSGSSADGQTKPWEQGDVSKEAPGIAHGRQEILRAQVARDMLQAKQQGKLPGYWEEWIDRILQPKLPWRQVLRQAARQAVSWASGQVDYSYARPSRRQDPTFIFPCLRGPELTACVILDTSGSMSTQDLQDALAEIDGILRQTTGACTGILCDAEVQVMKKIKRASDLAQIKGRGGTSMMVGIEAARQLKPRPDWCICCTDGWSPFPEHPTPFPLVIVLIGEGAADPDTLPDWATVIKTEDY